MKIPAEHEAEIQRIISSMECPRQGECCDPDSERDIRVYYLGEANLVECLDECGRECPFAVPFGRSVFCRCPIRNYFAEHGLGS